jgi:CheY-like chemotaxis protein
MAHTVLTIEDQPDIRRLVRMTLEFKGFKVIEAGNGPEGLQLARSARPDLILLDVMMPGMDGLAVSRALWADPDLKRIPVVMLSALGAPGDIEAGKATGVAEYLVKPFSPWQLLELVQRLIEGEPAPAAPATTKSAAEAVNTLQIRPVRPK